MALGGEVELVRAINSRLGRLSLDNELVRKLQTGERQMTYKVDGAVGGSLVTLLAVEEEALASLGGPRGHMVGNLGDLVGLERADRLQVDGVRAEPEELLGVEEVPRGAR